MIKNTKTNFINVGINEERTFQFILKKLYLKEIIIDVVLLVKKKIFIYIILMEIH